MKNYLIPIIIATVAFGVIVYFLTVNKEPTSLDAPLIMNLDKKYSATLPLSGTAYPGAKILVYVNDQYTDDILVDENGSFLKGIIFKEDGIKKIKTKQTYKNITSEFSSEFTAEADITPPDTKLFTLSNEFPESSKEKGISIKGTGSPNDFVILDGTRHKINNDGTFEINYELQEGDNNLEFSMTDDVSNSTEVLAKHLILVDTIPPTISNFMAPFNKKPTEEAVVIDIGTWQGYLDSVNSVAITGSVDGKLKSLTVDGKSISWDENNKIYQRINLYIYGGLNKYKVVAEDMAGNIATGYVDTNAERDNDEINLNVNQ